MYHIPQQYPSKEYITIFFFKFWAKQTLKFHYTVFYIENLLNLWSNCVFTNPCYCSLLQKDWRIICSNNNGSPSIHLSFLASLYAFIICNYINVYLIGTFLAVLFRALLRMFPSKLGFRTTVSKITFCSVSQWNPNSTRKSLRPVPSSLT